MKRDTLLWNAVGPSMLALMLAAATPGAAQAQRSGFVIGLGIGAAITSLNFEPRENKVGVATDFKIGYAPSERTAIYWSAKSTFFTLEDNFGDSNLNAVGVGGIGMTRFLPDTSPVAYIDGSLGSGHG